MAFGGGDSTGMSPIQEAVANRLNSVTTSLGTKTNMDAKNVARGKLLKDTYGDDYESNVAYKQQRTLLQLDGPPEEDEDKTKTANNGAGSGSGGISLGGGL